MSDLKFETPIVKVIFFYDQDQNLLIAKGSAQRNRTTIFADEALILTDLNIEACREIGSTPRIVYGVPDSFKEYETLIELDNFSSEVYDCIKSINPTA